MNLKLVGPLLLCSPITIARDWKSNFLRTCTRIRYLTTIATRKEKEKTEFITDINGVLKISAHKWETNNIIFRFTNVVLFFFCGIWLMEHDECLCCSMYIHVCMCSLQRCSENDLWSIVLMTFSIRNSECECECDCNGRKGEEVYMKKHTSKTSR